MTNAMLIFNEACRLMDEGIIGTTGRSVTVEDEKGNKVTYLEPEAIHTYAKWKELGFQVQKGQKAISEISIWKYVKSKNADEAAEVDESKMFLKKSFFFSAAQVKPIA